MRYECEYLELEIITTNNFEKVDNNHMIKSTKNNVFVN